MNRIAADARRLLAIFALALMASACAAKTEAPALEPPTRHFSEFENPDAVYPIDIYDPWEGFNRRVYKFNAVFDEFVFLPVVNAYETVTPQILRTGVSNFFANLSELTTFANEILQLKFKRAGWTAMRFVANATAGWLGFIDVAGRSGMKETQEDFGQTLGHYGVGDGPYLVLPLLGPSNLRDGTGFAVDTVAFAVVDPFTASSTQSEYPPILALNIIDKRYVQAFRYHESGSPFEYDLLRLLYTKKRRLDIQD
jgi:phospholipid-binding lipoprotein MlaA